MEVYDANSLQVLRLTKVSADFAYESFMHLTNYKWSQMNWDGEKVLCRMPLIQRLTNWHIIVIETPKFVEGDAIVTMLFEKCGSILGH